MWWYESHLTTKTWLGVSKACAVVMPTTKTDVRAVEVVDTHTSKSSMCV